MVEVVEVVVAAVVAAAAAGGEETLTTTGAMTATTDMMSMITGTGTTLIISYKLLCSHLFANSGA